MRKKPAAEVFHKRSGTTAPESASRETTMSIERLLMRRLHGELDEAEARRLEERLERAPGLRARAHRDAEVWDDLELPPATVPVGFSAEVMAAARQTAGEMRWSLAPAWARAASAAALAAGLIVGVSLGTAGSAPETQDDPQDVFALSSPLSLAESYWLALDESELAENGGESAQ